MKKLILAGFAALALAGCAQAEPEPVSIPDVYSAEIVMDGTAYSVIEYNDEFGQYSTKVLPTECIDSNCQETGSGLYQPETNSVIPWGSVDESQVNLISVGAWK